MAAALFGGVLSTARVADATPWLIVSDVHFDPTSRDPLPARYGSDTNLALLESSIAEMKRVDPAPPVVIITGDFLAHGFRYERAEATMKFLARRFDRAFPQAQFVIALGNEDSGCGDYEITARAPFLRAVATAWEPLVDRRGAAPAFVRTFSQDGHYETALPLSHVRAIVIDDVFWSPRYRAACGGTSGGRQTMTELRAALQDGSRNTNWVIAHVPPGVDAFSTTVLLHRLVVVPFLDPAQRYQWLAVVHDPRSHVALMVAAHSHKFAFRIDGDAGTRAVPILLVPSISPIFHNAPSFLTAGVRRDGTIERADEHSFLERRWRSIGGTRTLGLPAVTGADLRSLQMRLARDPQLRAEFARLYSGGGPPEIDERNWRSYWCAATAFSATAFTACLGHGRGIGLLTRRGVAVVGLAVCVVATLAALFAVRRYRRNRPNVATE